MHSRLCKLYRTVRFVIDLRYLPSSETLEYKTSERETYRSPGYPVQSPKEMSKAMWCVALHLVTLFIEDEGRQGL